MTRNSIALMRDGSVMADSDLVDFLSGPTDSAINFNGSADLHTPIHPPPKHTSIIQAFNNMVDRFKPPSMDWTSPGDLHKRFKLFKRSRRGETSEIAALIRLFHASTS